MRSPRFGAVCRGVVRVLAPIHPTGAKNMCVGERSGVCVCAILRWLTQPIETAHIDPGKPWQNGNDESERGRFREECQN